MTDRSQDQDLVQALFKDNPEVFLVLEIARRAKVAEERALPPQTVAPLPPTATPTPERRGSLVTPPLTQIV